MDGRHGHRWGGGCFETFAADHGGDGFWVVGFPGLPGFYDRELLVGAAVCGGGLRRRKQEICGEEIVLKSSHEKWLLKRTSCVWCLLHWWSLIRSRIFIEYLLGVGVGTIRFTNPTELKLKFRYISNIESKFRFDIQFSFFKNFSIRFGTVNIVR